MPNVSLVNKKSKGVVFRGMSRSEEYAEDRRAKEVTVGSRYKSGYHWLEWRGPVHRFKSIAQDVFLADNRETVSRYPQLKIQ